jgi:hypothetical protein
VSTGAAESGAQPLRLVSVLVSGLPAELGTSAAPARYTVPVVFSRQVTPEERARIEDPALARRLSEQVGVRLELAVSDRRLLVKNTSLAELRDGLASALAAALRDLDAQLGAEQSARDDEASRRGLEEHARADAVAREAAQIQFG